MHRCIAWSVVPLLLPACLDRSARPYDEYVDEIERLEEQGLLDTGVDPDTDTDTDTDSDTDTDTEPPRYDQLCGEDGGAEVTVTFVNASEVAADLYVVPSSCQPQNVVLLTVGQEAAYVTSVGAVWRLRDIRSLEWLDERRITAEDDRLELGDR